MFNDVHPLAALAIGTLFGVGLHIAADTLLDLLRAWRHRRRPQPPAPPVPCPLAVIEVVAVPPGQEEEVRERNIDLFTLQNARRMLNLYCTVSKGELAHLEQLLGIEAMYRPGNHHLVRLGRRGFHGT